DLPCITASSDGRTVAMIEVETNNIPNKSHLRLWDRQLRREVRIPISEVTQKASISSDGRWLATWGTEVKPPGLLFCTLRLWDVATGNELRCYRSTEFPSLLGFAPGDQFLLTRAQNPRGVELQWLAVDEDRVAYTLLLPQA